MKVLALLFCIFASAKAIKEICLLEPYAGQVQGNEKVMKNLSESYSYIDNFNECESFVYSGTGGNDNRFSTFEECQSACKELNPCLVKPFSGNELTGPTCFLRDDKWSYVAESNRCVAYRGCGGNENVFDTPEDCERQCKQYPCEDEPYSGRVSGRHNKSYKVYTYLNKSNKCVVYRYGGAGANFNHFKTIKDCEGTCVNRIMFPTE